MTVEIDVTSGPVRVVPVPATAVDVTLITSDCQLAGFSLRDATADVGNEVSGTVTSPGAGATIAQITNIPAGTYDVFWEVQLAGTLAAGDANNFQLSNTTGFTVNSVNLGAVGDYPQPEVEITAVANSTMKIVAIAAGTAGAIYTAILSLVPKNQANTVVELQDGNNPLAELSLGAGSADSRWYGDAGLHTRGTIRLHVISGAVTGAVYVRYSDSTG